MIVFQELLSLHFRMNAIVGHNINIQLVVFHTVMTTIKSQLFKKCKPVRVLVDKICKYNTECF